MAARVVDLLDELNVDAHARHRGAVTLLCWREAIIIIFIGISRNVVMASIS